MYAQVSENNFNIKSNTKLNSVDLKLKTQSSTKSSYLCNVQCTYVTK